MAGSPLPAMIIAGLIEAGFAEGLPPTVPGYRR